MASFGTKSILINEPASWGMSGSATELKIPGFGTFTVADMLNVSAVKGAAATKGVFKYTIAGTPGEASIINLTMDIQSNRYAAENVRMNSNPGSKEVFSVTASSTDTAATIAGKLRDAMNARAYEHQKLPFTVSGATNEIILTMDDENTRIANANTGFGGGPYVESVATGREIPGKVTAALSVTTAPVAAVGIGKDLEENEFLSTAASVAPYAEIATDRPIPTELYNQFHFDIPRTFVHEVQGAPDAVKGSVSFSVYVLASKEEDMYLTWNAIGAKSVEEWDPIVVV